MIHWRRIFFSSVAWMQKSYFEVIKLHEVWTPQFLANYSSKTCQFNLYRFFVSFVSCFLKRGIRIKVVQLYTFWPTMDFVKDTDYVIESMPFLQNILLLRRWFQNVALLWRVWSFKILQFETKYSFNDVIINWGNISVLFSAYKFSTMWC